MCHSLSVICFIFPSEMDTVLGLFIFTGILLLNSNDCTAIRCLSCTDVVQPRHCHYVANCGQGEICMTEKFQTITGQVLFNVGCKSNTTICNTNRISKPRRIKYTRAGDRVTQILCEQCCDADMCNSIGCGEIGYPMNRGPICFNCPQTNDPSTCDTIAVCNQNEGCFTESQTEFGDTLYKTHCLRKELCDLGTTGAGIVGKRAAFGTCISCCYTDFCNNQCNTTVSIPTSSIPPKTMTTPSIFISSHTNRITSPSALPDCINGSDKCQAGHSGKEFLLMFLQSYDRSHVVTLIITSKQRNTNVTIETPFTQYTRTFTIPDYGTEISLPKQLPALNMGVENKGVFIRSSSPVSVYGFNRITDEAIDGFAAIPTNRLGTMYKAITYHPRRSLGSVIGIAALADDTRVSIRLNTSGTLNYNHRYYTNGSSLHIMLNKSQTFQVQYNRDLTGTLVESNKPVAVLSGNRCSDIPSFCNHLVEFLPPLSTWGKNFVIPPLPSAKEMIIRVVPNDRDTKITISGHGSIVTSNTVEKSLSGSRPSTVECDKPCLVVKFSKYDQTNEIPPFMTIIPSLTQFSNEYSIQIPSVVEHFTNNYISVIIKVNFKGGIQFDGTDLISKNHTAVQITLAGELWTALTFPVFPGYHYIYHIDNNVTFGLIMYGYTKDKDGYGFPVGLNIQ